MNIHYYKTASGREPAREYINKLPIANRVIITGDLELIRNYGIIKAPVKTRKLIEKLWEKKIPDFKKAVTEHIEKIKLAEMIKEIRQKENLSQLELAEKAHVTQSVIARIETNRARTLPRIDLFHRIIQSAGYE